MNVTTEQTKKRFPIGGSRQAVYDFMYSRGFVMSRNSDKCWLRPADGVEAHIYGAGSMARVFSQDGKMLCDDELLKAIKRNYRAGSSPISASDPMRAGDGEGS